MLNNSNSINLKEIKALSWGVRKRLEFIEFRLYWEGRINRSDLISVFRISIPQASADFSKYQKIAPENMKYDRNGKFYYASSKFKPILRTPSADQFLLRYIASKSRTFNQKKSFLGNVPPIDTVPIPWRRIDPEILKKLLLAIRNKKAIEIEYQSLSRTEKLMRKISPHALGFDGFRWHCRAFCHIDNSFKDFNLGRILKIGNEEDSNIDPQSDEKWENYIEVKIGPNPQFEENHRKIIEYEYGMENGEASIKVRRAMLWYLLSSLGLSAREEDKVSSNQQIILLNKDEVREAL